MLKRYWTFAFAIMILFFGSTSFAENSAAKVPANVNFVLLRPDTDHPFWALFESVMKATCQDLGCHVDVYYANWDHFKMVEQARSLGKLPYKPDMVFFQSFKNNGADIIKVLNDQKINAFLINAGLTPEQSEEMGRPRGKYKYWIGQMMPDDFAAGFSDAEALYKAAKEKGYMKDGKIQFAAIEGNSADGASIERLKGLHSFVKDHDDVDLLQIVQGKWDTDVSNKLTLGLLNRYPDLHVIWAAGDPIALGVVDAASSNEAKGRSILTAGVDWAPKALVQIDAGTIVGSAGGHFMEGAWAPIMAFDYLMGIDFVGETGLEAKSKMFFMNKETLVNYRQKFGNGDFGSVDFKKFSKYFNPKLSSYDFNLFSYLLPGQEKPAKQ